MGDPGFRPIAVGLFCAGFTTFALLYATQPLLPALVDAYGITPGTASLSISVTTAALALGVIPASALSERWGRRPVMVGSLAAAVVFGLAAAVVPGFALLLVLRGLEGLALAGLPAVGMAYLADEIDGEHLGGAMGLYIAGNSVGGFGGRIIVSAIADLTGSWRWALGGIALVSGACLVAFVLVLPASRRFRPRPVGVGELLGEARAHLARPGAAPLLRRRPARHGRVRLRLQLRDVPAARPAVPVARARRRLRLRALRRRHRHLDPRRPPRRPPGPPAGPPRSGRGGGPRRRRDADDVAGLS